MADYSLEPVDVKKVSTRYRTIQTRIPVPESLAIFASLKKSEPRSMMGMPPVVWDRAENFSVDDKWGNRLMRMRIVAQMFALAMFALGLFLMRQGG